MQLKEGDIVVGKITGITGFGVFADIGDGVPVWYIFPKYPALL